MWSVKIRHNFSFSSARSYPFFVFQVNGYTEINLKVKNSLKTFFFIFFLFLFSCDGLIEDWKVSRLTDDFINWHSQTFPFENNISGNCKKNHVLFNTDLKNIKKINEQLDTFKWRLFLIDTSTITFKNRVNFYILRSKINFLLFEFQEWKRWQHDTYFYSQKLYNEFKSFFPQPSDTSKNNFEKYFYKIKSIPGFLKNARKNLVRINNKNIDTAIEQIESVKNELFNQFSIIQTSDSVMLDSLNYFSEVALDSLLSFQQFLTDENSRTQDSLPHFDKNMYQSLLSILLENDLLLDSLVKIVERDYQASVQEMAVVAQNYFDEQNKSFRNVSKERLCAIMINEINRNIPRKDRIISICINHNNYHKLFVDEIVDFSLPTDFSMKIDWGNNNGNYPQKLVELLPVNLTDDSCFLRLKIEPIPQDIEWSAQLAMLRDYNRTHLKAAMLLDGFPIHYNYWFQKRHELPFAAKVFPSQSYLAGFTHNFASTLVTSGLGGYDKLLEFAMLESFARLCFSTIVELKYYLRQYSNQQVDSLIKVSKLFNTTQSKKLIKDINCNPGQNLLTYRGIRKFKNIEIKYTAFQGRKFRKKKYYKLILQQGPIPLVLLEEKLMP